MSLSAFFNYPGTEPAIWDTSVEFLADLDDAGWARLLEYCEMLRFAPGQDMVPAGVADRACYIVADGSLEAVRADGSTEPVEPGAVLGAVTFFDGGPHPAAVRAASDSEVFRLSFEAFDVLAAREPALARMVLTELGRTLAQRVRRTGYLV